MSVKKFLIVIIAMSFLTAPYVSMGESEAERRKRLENQLQQIERQILKQQVLQLIND